jgi:DNA-binding CsgD family transcriptional regulator
VAVRTQQPAAASARNAPPGRFAALTELLDALRAGRGVTLFGPAGVGKTKLVSAATDALAAAGQPVATIFGTTATSSVPLAALSSLFSGSDDEARPDFANAPTDGLLIAHARAAVMHRLSHNDVRLLVVDDTHLVDALSAVVLRQLADTGRVQLLLVVREPHQVPQALRPLVDDQLVAVSLGPLDVEGSLALAEEFLGGQLAGRSIARLYELSQGVPLVLTQLLRIGFDSGALAQHRGVWRLDGQLPADARLGALVSSRLSGVRPRDRAALETLAIAEPLDLDVLADIAGTAVVEALEESGLIRVESAAGLSRAKLAHPLYAQWLRSALPHSRRKRLAAALAVRLDAVPDIDPLRTAMVRVEAGLATDPTRLLEAGRIAARHDWQLAHTLLRAAVDNGGGAPAMLELAELCSLPQPTQARELLAALETLPLTADERLATTTLSAFVTTLSPDRASESPSSALDDPPADPANTPLPIRLAAATAHLFTGSASAAYALAEPAATDRALPAPARWPAFVCAVAAAATTGQLDSAIGLAQLARDELSNEPDPLGSFAAVAAAAALAHERRGELERADELAAEVLEVATARDDTRGVVRMTQCRARVALLRGQPVQAARWLRDVVADLRGADEIFLAWNLGLLAVAEAMRGRADLAQVAVQQLGAVPADLPVYRPEQQLCRAEVLACAGDLVAARSVATAAAQRAEEIGQAPVALLAWHAVARFGSPRNALPGVRGAVRGVDGSLATALASDVEAQVAGDAVAVMLAADSLASMEFRSFAIYSYAAAIRLAGAGGAAREEARARSHLQSVLAACDPLTLPAAFRARSAQDLTARERDVAALAVTGVSDRAIAERLGVSVRTVQTHLTRIYAKTQSAGRRDLATVLDLSEDADFTSKPVARMTPLPRP